MRTIVIVGNGISGITAARHIRKRSDDRIVVVSAETPYFFSRTALMYVYMGHMKFEHTQPYENWFWEKNRIELVQDYVESVDATKRVLHLKEKSNISFDVLILATGSKSNKFGWPGQDLPGVQGLYSFQDLQLLEANTHGPKAKEEERKVKRAVIVGGGLIGVELAEMLLTRGIAVTFLVREGRFWGNVLPKEEGELVARHVKEHHVDLRFETELDSIQAGPDGRVQKILTKAGEEIECELVGLTAGVSPNVDFLKGGEIEVQRGIMIDQSLQTNVEGIYAIGDCAQMHEAVPGRRPIEQVWYTGRMMGEAVAKTVTGETTRYAPGPWFNSAKFFDIEYQTYGTVMPTLSEGHTDFYWEHPEGKICLKVVLEEKGRKLLGVNIFGIRLRHELLDAWLRADRSADYFMEHFRDANFDPEFFRDYAPEILELYNAKFGTQIKARKRSWSRILTASK